MMFGSPLREDSVKRWKDINQQNLHRDLSTPEKSKGKFQSPSMSKTPPPTDALVEEQKTNFLLPMDHTLQIIDAQLNVLKTRCEAQSLGVFQLEKQIEALRVTPGEPAAQEVDDTNEEFENLQNEISALEKRLEETLALSEQRNAAKECMTMNAAEERAKMDLCLQLTDLLEKQENQSAAVLELSTILSSQKEQLECFRVFREEQRLVINTLEEERDQKDINEWNSDLPTPVNETKFDYAHTKIQMLRDQLAKSEESYIEKRGLFLSRVATEREKLHEIKDQLQVMRDAHDHLVSMHQGFLDNSDESVPPRKKIMASISPFSRHRFGSVDNFQFHRDRTSSNASISSEKSSPEGKETGNFGSLQNGKASRARLALRGAIEALTRPRSPDSQKLNPKRGVKVKAGRVSQHHQSSWMSRHAILYKCDECYQLRLADTTDMIDPDIINLTPESSSVTNVGSEKPNGLLIEADQFKVGATTISLAFKSVSETEEWRSMLSKAVSETTVVAL